MWRESSQNQSTFDENKIAKTMIITFTGGMNWKDMDFVAEGDNTKIRDLMTFNMVVVLCLNPWIYFGIFGTNIHFGDDLISKIQYKSKFNIHYFEKHKKIHSNLAKFLNSNNIIGSKKHLVNCQKSLTFVLYQNRWHSYSLFICKNQSKIMHLKK